MTTPCLAATWMAWLGAPHPRLTVNPWHWAPGMASCSGRLQPVRSRQLWRIHQIRQVRQTYQRYSTL